MWICVRKATGYDCETVVRHGREKGLWRDVRLDVRRLIQ